MPCNDNYGPYNNRSAELSYADSIRISNLEASLCAILRELEKSNNHHIIDAAERNGKVDIRQFKKDHFARDDQRINDLLDNLSEHEKQMLKDKLK